MLSYNKVMIAGNLTRDVEVRYLATGTPVTTLGLASNRKYKTNGESKEDTVFVDVEVWGKQAELCSQYLSKGRNVFIEGRLKFDSWEDEGKKKSKLLVTAEYVHFVDSKSPKEERQETSAEPKDEDGTTPF